MSALPWVFLLASGCTWVTQEKFDEQLAQVDDDGDGDRAFEDCDDLDATIGPSQVETWYNGVDNDCGQDDDYDQDNDGYVPLEYLGMATDGVEGTGGLSGGDCDDTLPTVSPIQPDTWYDGVDKDCDGSDDYDADLDGYVPDTYAGLTTQYVSGSGSLPAGDCDDELYDVKPGGADVAYDGSDTDCAGNDDYDVDGDGYVFEEIYDEYGITEYVSGSGLLPNGDCDDEDAAINPGAADAWYDDIDSDCAEDDDFDQDGDGVQSAQDAPGGTDCDDTVATAYPGALETLGDAEDSDCNGTDDSFILFDYEDYTWTGPARPVFAEDGGYVYLSVAATLIVTDSGTNYYDSAVALRLEATDPVTGVQGVNTWATNTSNNYTYSGAHDFTANGGYLYGVVGVVTTTTRQLRLTRYEPASLGRVGKAVQSATWSTPFSDADIVLASDGSLYVVGCEEDVGVLHYAHVDIAAGDALENEEVSDIWASACALDFSDGDRIFTSEADGILQYGFDQDADPLTFTGSPFNPTYFPLDLDIPDGLDEPWVVFADESSGSVVALDADLNATVLASGAGAVAVDVYQDPDGVLYAVWADESGDGWLGWGDPDGDWSTTQVDVDFAVTDVSVWATEGAVYVGAVGTSNVAVGAAWQE